MALSFTSSSFAGERWFVYPCWYRYSSTMVFHLRLYLIIIEYPWCFGYLTLRFSCCADLGTIKTIKWMRLLLSLPKVNLLYIVHINLWKLYHTVQVAELVHNCQCLPLIMLAASILNGMAARRNCNTAVWCSSLIWEVSKKRHPLSFDRRLM